MHTALWTNKRVSCHTGRIAAIALSCCAALSIAGAGLALTPVAYAETTTTQPLTIPAPARTVSVAGSATISVEPDVADLFMGIRLENTSAAACQNEATQQIDQVRAALTESGIPEEDIIVSDVSLHSIYDYSGDNEKLIGYHMNVSINVLNLPVDKIGSTIALATEAGCNQVDYASYHCSNHSEYYAQALRDAVAAASAKAQVLADAAGYELGSLTYLQEGYTSEDFRRTSNLYYEAGVKDAAPAAEEAVAGGLALNPGKLDIRADVTAVFELLLP